MRRGEVWTVRDGAYASKARPAVVVQADHVSEAFRSVVLVGLTTFALAGAAERVRLEPTEGNGLRETSYAMAEKPFSVKAERLGSRVGMLGDDDVSRIAAALAAVLGITVRDVTAPDANRHTLLAD